MTDDKIHRLTRRSVLGQALFGASMAGARALATGIPAWVFLRAPEAWAAEPEKCSPASPQYIVYATSGAGDPVNCNSPGTYDAPDIVHANDPIMRKTPLSLNGRTVDAAQFWTKLPQDVLDRTVFFHHGTYTNTHTAHRKVLKLMGSVARQEMLLSALAKGLGPCLNTVQIEPVSAGAGNIVSFEGRGLPNMRPTALKDVLTKPTGVLAGLAELRDSSLDSLHAVLKKRGTPAQRRFIDDYALSRRQARGLSDALLGDLTNVTSDRQDGQMVAAVTLIRMNVAPIVAVRIRFGGDNHSDPDLATEVAESASGSDTILQLMNLLKNYGLEDRVTFVMHNVFGRTLKKDGLRGRSHWGSHHTTVMIGKGLRGGVIGGIAPKGDDYQALPIDSTTGAGNPDGDIDYLSTQGAMAKTLAAAVGISPEFADENILKGKVVRAALA